MIKKINKRHLSWILRSIPNVLWPLKIWITRSSLKSVGKNFRFGPNCSFYDHKLISVGNNVFFSDGCVIGATVKVTIGNDVMFGPQVMIRGGDHNFSKVGYKMNKVKEGGVNLPVEIEDDVWVGARCTILKGVQICEGAVIGAGSLVTRRVLPYTVNVGLPSKTIRSRFTANELRLHLSTVQTKYSFEEVANMYDEQGINWRS